jgi:hypothetical protein
MRVENKYSMCVRKRDAECGDFFLSNAQISDKNILNITYFTSKAEWENTGIFT